MRIALLPYLAVLLLAGCSGPCDELDEACEKQCDAEQVGTCKYVVTKLSDDACDEVLLLSTERCPLEVDPIPPADLGR